MSKRMFCKKKIFSLTKYNHWILPNMIKFSRMFVMSLECISVIWQTTANSCVVARPTRPFVSAVACAMYQSCPSKRACLFSYPSIDRKID